MFYPAIQILLDQGRFADAEVAIREELKSNMEDPGLFHILSVALLSQEKPKEAEAAIREALSLDADFDPGFYMLSRCLLAQAKNRQALKAVEEAISMDPDDPDYHCQKAQVYLDWGKYKQSLQAAEEGLAVYPEHEGCRFFRSITLERLGRKDEADAESESLLADDPEDYHNHCARGWVLAQRRDTEGAERHFAEALRIEPNGEDARAGLAFTFRMKSPILGSMMRLLIWLERIPWWVFLVGIVFALNFADKMAASNMPPPVPQLGVGIRILFWAFFLIALLINPLFNLILLTSKTARHALSNDERKAVKWFILPLSVSLIYLVLWCIGSGRSFPVHAVTWAALVRFIYETFEATKPAVRKAMAAISFLMLAGVIWVEYFTYGYLIPKSAGLFGQYGESLWAARVEGEELGDWDRANNRAFFEGLQSLVTLRIRLINYVALAMWLMACFSDDIANFLIRRSPD